MEDPHTEKTPQPVGRERALEHARLAIRRDWAGEVPGFESWYAFEVDPDPLVLYDLVHDGPPGREAWRVEVVRAGRPVGWVFVTPGGSYRRPAGENVETEGGCERGPRR